MDTCVYIYTHTDTHKYIYMIRYIHTHTSKFTRLFRTVGWSLFRFTFIFTLSKIIHPFALLCFYFLKDYFIILYLLAQLSLKWLFSDVIYLKISSSHHHFKVVFTVWRNLGWHLFFSVLWICHFLVFWLASCLLSELSVLWSVTPLKVTCPFCPSIFV